MHPSKPFLRVGILALSLVGILECIGGVSPAFAVCRIHPSCATDYGCAMDAVGPFTYSGSGIRNLFLFSPVPCNAVPGVNASSTQSFQVVFDLEYTTDAVHWIHANGVANGTLLLGPVITGFETYGIDTEILQLDMSAGLPPNIRIRESPTQGSLGHNQYYNSYAPDGSFLVDSFFDVFTELSLDSGQTWTPADQAIHLSFDEIRPTAVMTPSWGALKQLYR